MTSVTKAAKISRSAQPVTAITETIAIDCFDYQCTVLPGWCNLLGAAPNGGPFFYKQAVAASIAKLPELVHSGD